MSCGLFLRGTRLRWRCIKAPGLAGIPAFNGVESSYHLLFEQLSAFVKKSGQGDQKKAPAGIITKLWLHSQNCDFFHFGLRGGNFTFH
jgi:hypothetical protein